MVRKVFLNSVFLLTFVILPSCASFDAEEGNTDCFPAINKTISPGPVPILVPSF